MSDSDFVTFFDAAKGGSEPGPTAAASDDGGEWAILEIMGHRKHAGRVREVQKLGGTLLRIDIPVQGDPATYGWETAYYSHGSIFSISACKRGARAGVQPTLCGHPIFGGPG